LIDLPSLTVQSESHPLLRAGSSGVATKIDRIVAGLGSVDDHGPLMLAWMLARYLASPFGIATEEDPQSLREEVLCTYQKLGKSAIFCE